MTTGSTVAPEVRIELSADLEAELRGLHAVADAARAADGEIERNSFEGFRAYYRNLEHCTPSTDLAIARQGDEIVAYARVSWSDTTDGERWYESVCFVHPDHRRRGIGRRLLEWTEARRLELAAADDLAGAAPDRPRRFTSFNNDGGVGGDVLLRAAGYEPFRRFYSMCRPDLADIADHPLPAGLEIRPIPNEPGAIRAIVRADNEAFADHFGSVDDEDIVFAQIVEDPETDTSLWVVAFEGDEVAGRGAERDPRGPRRHPGRLAGFGLHPPAMAPARPRPGVDRPEPRPAPGAWRLQRRARRGRVEPEPGARPVRVLRLPAGVEHDELPEGRPVFARSIEPGGGRTMIDMTVDVPDAPPIPDLRFRLFDPARDYPAFVDLIREAHLADGVDYLPTVEAVRSDHEHHQEYDPRRDVVLAEIDGALVAAATTDVRTRAGVGNHQVEGWVRPAWRRRGLGRALLGWTEARAAAVARVDGRPPERVLSAWPDEGQVGALALYESAGYRVVRYGFMMVRDLAEPIQDRPMPDGLEVRPVVEADHRRIWEADAEAFRDHWNPARADRRGFHGPVREPRDSTRPSGRSPGTATRSPARSSPASTRPRTRRSAWPGAGSTTSASAGRGAGGGSRPR